MPKGASGCFWRKLTVCGAQQPQGAPQPGSGSETLPGKVLRWLVEDVGASGKRGCCKKKKYIYPSHQAVHESCSVTVSCVKQGKNLFFVSVLTRLMSNIGSAKAD